MGVECKSRLREIFDDFYASQLVGRDEASAAVRNLPEWRDIPPLVYFLLDEDVVVYCGVTGSMVQRLEGHRKREGHKKFDSVRYMELPRLKRLVWRSFFLLGC